MLYVRLTLLCKERRSWEIRKALQLDDETIETNEVVWWG